MRKILIGLAVHLIRFSVWWSATAIALIIVALYAPQQVPVLVYKILQVTIAVTVGYLADRSLFGHLGAISEAPQQGSFGAARIIARALIVVGVILGLTLGI